MYGEEYHFGSDPRRDAQRPICIVIFATKWNYRRKTWIATKRNAQDERESSEATRKGAWHKFPVSFGAGESTILTAWHQKLTKRSERTIAGTKTSYGLVDHAEDQEMLKQRKNN